MFLYCTVFLRDHYCDCEISPSFYFCTLMVDFGQTILHYVTQSQNENTFTSK